MSRPIRMSVRDWRAGFGVVDPRDKEVISYSIWHRQNYVSAATLALEFFQVVASGINGNLNLAGQLPAGFHFLIQAIRVAILADTRETAAAAPAAGEVNGPLFDIKELSYDGTALLKVGDKEYGRWPIWMLPAGGGPTGQLAVPGTLTAPAISQLSAATNGVPDPRAVYTLPIPVVIPSQYNFLVRLEWDAAKTLEGGNTAVCVVLDGELMRPKQ